ncbi:hypothetical protein OUZ56_022098 [Daphnia magna]|uniref:Uncharacterized protein n=1 Tax=Daphnia magna TaxID=35525 RepID=A0ABR0AVD4_9CRUS|nr:hypothetical protein OUZ56_022098 [Daphnia magna]
MNITILFRVFIYYVLLTISLQHPMYPDFEASLLSQPSSIHFNSSLCLPNANRNKGSYPLMPYHEIENVIVNPAAKSSFRTSHAVLDFSWNFLVSKIHPGLKGHPTSCCHTCLAVFALPSLPHNLCSRPASLHRRHRGTSRFWDRRRCSAPWLITHGVGQSPCALGRRRQCTSRDFPLSMRWWSTWGVHSRKGLHRQVSPDLSSDKSPFHRIPLKRCVAIVEEQPMGCNGLAANGIEEVSQFQDMTT